MAPHRPSSNTVLQWGEKGILNQIILSLKKNLISSKTKNTSLKDIWQKIKNASSSGMKNINISYGKDDTVLIWVSKSYDKYKDEILHLPATVGVILKSGSEMSPTRGFDFLKILDQK